MSKELRIPDGTHQQFIEVEFTAFYDQTTGINTLRASGVEYTMTAAEFMEAMKSVVGMGLDENNIEGVEFKHIIYRAMVAYGHRNPLLKFKHARPCK